MSSARTKRHNNLHKDGKRRVAYREFGIHLSLTTVTEKAVRWYSRSLRHLPLEQLKHWRRSSTNWRQLSASSPACTAAPLDESPASSVESRKCSCVVNGKLHVFIGESVGLWNASVFPERLPPNFREVCDTFVTYILQYYIRVDYLFVNMKKRFPAVINIKSECILRFTYVHGGNYCFVTLNTNILIFKFVQYFDFLRFIYECTQIIKYFNV